MPKCCFLYTFFFQYQGGIYISQASGEDVSTAMKEWAKNLDISTIPNVGKHTKNLLVKELDNEEATPVATVENVWCFTVLPRGRFGMVHVVKTQILIL